MASLLRPPTVWLMTRATPDPVQIRRNRPLCDPPSTDNKALFGECPPHQARALNHQRTDPDQIPVATSRPSKSSMVKGRDVVIIKEIGDLLPPACRIATSAMRKRQPRPTLFTFSSINIVVNINTLVRDKTQPTPEPRSITPRRTSLSLESTGPPFHCRYKGERKGWASSITSTRAP
ncbi:MAG: hypothetical protein Ct9H300mP8_02500 [Gammaproteobacteria bacterium]|nr:MAG: hypothetical protein Ct9H300mP8_02500 [Gammaproteobacteria bacterium]